MNCRTSTKKMFVETKSHGGGCANTDTSRFVQMLNEMDSHLEQMARMARKQGILSIHRFILDHGIAFMPGSDPMPQTPANNDYLEAIAAMALPSRNTIPAF